MRAELNFYEIKASWFLISPYINRYVNDGKAVNCFLRKRLGVATQQNTLGNIDEEPKRNLKNNLWFKLNACVAYSHCKTSFV